MSLSKRGRRAIRRAIKQMNFDRIDPLALKAQIAAEIARCESGGSVAVVVWSRDCDMCEGTELRIIPAHVSSYLRLLDELHQWAEGPFNATIITSIEAEQFQPSFRDRALEAWENGRGANAYCV
jgi:hypothetical protein